MFIVAERKEIPGSRLLMTALSIYPYPCAETVYQRVANVCFRFIYE